GQHEHRGLVAVLAQPAQHARAVEVGHGHVEDDEVVADVGAAREALFAVARLVEVEAHLLHLLGDDRADRAAVIDRKDSSHFPAPSLSQTSRFTVPARSRTTRHAAAGGSGTTRGRPSAWSIMSAALMRPAVMLASSRNESSTIALSTWFAGHEN